MTHAGGVVVPPPRRLKPNVIYTAYSPNIYPGELRPRGILLHDAEMHEYRHSTRDLRMLADYMGTRRSEVSVQVATDDDGNSTRIVNDRNAAWHCEQFNLVLLGIEQIGFARQHRWAEDQLWETARWIAQWSFEHHIPIRHGSVSGERIVRWGVFTHAQLGIAGGGHTDPGENYPLTEVLVLAQRIRQQRYGGRRHRHDHR